MIAFVCDQSVQVMRAIQLNMYVDEFKGDADIYIGSSFRGAEQVAKRLDELHIFKRVIFADKDKKPQKAGIFRLIYGRTTIALELKKEKYETLVSFNLESDISTALYNRNKNNAGFVHHIIEDGPGLYPIPMLSKYGKLHPYSWLGIDKPFFHTYKWWFSAPELMIIPLPNQNKCELPAIDIKNDEFRNVINYVYDYQPDPMLEEADIMIMEESFFTDGVLSEEMDDFQVFDTIRKQFPNANIVVKLHPRTKENRFEEDFKILKGQGIAWEIYLLNMLGKERIPIQIGIRCATLQSDKFCFSAEGKKISLIPMFVGKVKGSANDAVNDAMVDLLKQIRDSYREPDKFLIAEDMNQVVEQLNVWLSYSKHNEKE